MTQPAGRNKKKQVCQVQKYCLWYLLAMVLLVACVEMIMNRDWLMTKSVAAGASLNFIAQSIFILVAYSNKKLRQGVLLNMYLGQMLKWLTTLVGFALIFIHAQPISAVSVVTAYFVMQLFCLVGLFKMR
ncbi:hypothetical protein M2R47_03335 [Moraxella sp. Tifton1]|uniref:hypothetical protein n=1 Tax=Moraxella oculi TaxID=2940516 RepID=UPI00201142AE|nr:hypothetical protein [Moraxella sp. Tifton1]MCL1623286.1 hypothetical protein [Moraxella sp. Tifton1]